MTSLVIASLKADEELNGSSLSINEQVLETQYAIVDEEADKRNEDANEPSCSEQVLETEESDTAMEILELIKDNPLEMPEPESPSRIMVFIREYGLALVYSYYDLKAWIIKKVCGENS